MWFVICHLSFSFPPSFEPGWRRKRYIIRRYTYPSLCGNLCLKCPRRSLSKNSEYIVPGGIDSLTSPLYHSDWYNKYRFKHYVLANYHVRDLLTTLIFSGTIIQFVPGKCLFRLLYCAKSPLSRLTYTTWESILPGVYFVFRA